MKMRTKLALQQVIGKELLYAFENSHVVVLF